MKDFDVSKLSKKLMEIDTFEYSGTVSKLIGLTVESLGPSAKIGDICKIYSLDEDNHIDER